MKVTSRSRQEPDDPAVTIQATCLSDETPKSLQPHGGPALCPCRHQNRSNQPHPHPLQAQAKHKQAAGLTCPDPRPVIRLPLQQPATTPARHPQTPQLRARQRYSPRDDLADHADGLFVGVGHHLAIDGDDLAMDLVGPPRIVVDVLHTLGQVDVPAYRSAVYDLGPV